MTNLYQTFQNKFSDWTTALLEHLQISLAALLVAILIGVPLGILVMNRRKVADGVVQITGILQTIPSLAILGLLIPFIGIGKFPAIVALVVYGVFPILQNTITAFQEIDPDLEEAATAFGMTWCEKLKKYQLALAMPIVMSGIRTSAVMIIGTATLAALIGAGGLGSFILLGIDRNNSQLILIGAISSALLAILFNWTLKHLETKKVKTMLLSLLSLFLLLGASFAKPIYQQTTSEKLVVAGKMGPEPEILINMYKILIEDKTDLTVEVKPNFGKTSFLYEALKSGDIDIYPEFTGTITSSLLSEKPAYSTDKQKVYQQAKTGIAKQDDLTLLQPMAYQNNYALAVTESFANEYHIEAISDLKKVESQLKAGFTLEFNDREDGNKGLASLYDLQLDAQTMEPALRYEAIKQGDINLMEVYTTDTKILTYHLKVLEDDKKLFPPYQGAPLLRQETLDAHPELADVLNQLAGKVSNNEMIQMNYQVEVEGKSADAVAEAYLKTEGLIE